MKIIAGSDAEKIGSSCGINTDSPHLKKATEGSDKEVVDMDISENYDENLA